MKSNLASSQPTSVKSAVQNRLRRLALIGLGCVVAVYVVGVTAGFLWLRHGRKIEHVRILDVALFQVDSVREAIGRQHYVRARAEAEAKNYQGAYLSYASALRQDPDNVTGRLEAAAFFRTVGAANQCLAVLEEGLTRQPGEARLIQATFDHLLTSGRAGYALDLLRRRYGKGLAGESAPMLLTYEIRTTLLVQGAEAARQLLQKHPELRNYPLVAPVMARVLWESSERIKAIGLMVQHVGTAEADYEDHARLASWQESAGLTEDAIKTAQLACRKYPGNAAARALLIEMQASSSPTKGPALGEVTAYLQDFNGRADAMAQLAATAGRKGWVGLTRMLYDLAATSHADLGFLALSHADALARNARFAEFKELLAQLESQAAENGHPAFQTQLRLRQVIAAGALRDSDGVREYSRRLASLVRGEPDRLETFRQFFLKNGLPDAVIELGPRSSPAKAVAPKVVTGT